MGSSVTIVAAHHLWPIARLRKKVEADPDHPRLIKTVRGMGYMFAANGAREA